MSKETFKGTTVEAALEQAAEKLGVPAADLEHEVVEQKRDFWGTGDDTVTIEAWTRAAEPEEQPEPAAESEEQAEPAAESEEQPEPAAAAEPAAADAEPESDATSAGTAVEVPEDGGAQAPAADADGGGFWSAEEEEITERAEEKPAEVTADGLTADVATASKEQEAPATSGAVADADGEDVEPAAIAKLLEQIFHDMEFDCTVEVEAQPDGFLATINGDDKEALLEGNGRALSALELIANNAFRHKLPPGNKVRVDAGDFRSRRDDELSDLALQVAHSAKESGRTQETQPLNPYERRLVHLALAEDAGVTTVSRGSGFLKNVQVIPERGGGGNRGGRGRGRRS